MSNFLKVGEGLSFLKLASAPVSPTEGMVYYDDTLNTLRYYNGTQWIDIGDSAVDSVNGQTGTVVLELNDIDDVNVPAPSDGQVLTYDSGTSTWVAEAPAGAGANTALSNLASTAVNADIIPNLDVTVDLGSSTKRYAQVHAEVIQGTPLLEVNATAVDITGTASVTLDAPSIIMNGGPVEIGGGLLDMNGFRVTEVGVATVGTDAVNKNVLDTYADVNYITNGTAEVNATGWAVYADAATAIPVNGTGGSPNVTITRNTSTPLRGTGQFRLTKDAANRQGQGTSYDFTINYADLSKVLTISFDYAAGAGFSYNGATYASPSDIAVYIYNTTTTDVIYPSQSFLDGSGKFISQFQTLPSGINYRLIFHVATGNTTAWTLDFDNVKVGPSVIATGAVMSDWISYTPVVAGLGTGSATATGFYRRVGDSAEIQVRVLKDGSSGTGTVAVTATLPPGLVADTAKITSNTAQISLGVWSAFGIKASNTNQIGNIWLAGGLISFSNTGDVSGNPIQGGNFTASSYITSNNIKIPIVGWSSNVQVSSDYGSRVIAVEARGTPTGGLTALTSTVWGTEDRDTTASYNSATGEFVAPETGFYEFDAGVEVTPGTVALSNIVTLKPYIDGVAQPKFGGVYRYVNTNAATVTVQSTGCLFLNANQILTFRTNTNTTGPSFTAADSASNYLSIRKVQSPQTLAGGEVVAFQGRNTAGTTVNTSLTIIPFTAVKDTHGSWLTNQYTVSQTGFYDISWLLYTSGVNLSTSQFFASAVYVDGVEAILGHENYGNGVLIAQTTSGSTAAYYLTAGQVITLRAVISVSNTLQTGPARNYFTISKVG